MVSKPSFTQYSANHFTLKVIDDPSGNSFVENKFAPDSDPCLSEERYTRTDEQNRLLDITPPETQVCVGCALLLLMLCKGC